MTTTVKDQPAAAPAAASVERNPFPVLPGNEKLDGSVQDAEPAPEAVTTDAQPRPEGEVETKPEEVDGAAAADDKNPDGSDKTPEAPKVKLWADQYKTPEELEIAHKHSSAEGKRLAARVKEIEASAAAQKAELASRIAELELQAQLGPEVPELTDEDLEKMGPVKAARAIQAQADRKRLVAELKAKKEQREAKQKEFDAQVKAHLDEQMDEMMAAPDKFPEYRELLPEMNDLADKLPWVTGNPNSVRLVYYAAFGRRALANLSKAKSVTKDSVDKAKAKAASDASATAVPGSEGGAKDPVKKAQPLDPDSDEAVNKRMQDAYARKHPALI